MGHGDKAVLLMIDHDAGIVLTWVEAMELARTLKRQATYARKVKAGDRVGVAMTALDVFSVGIMGLLLVGAALFTLLILGLIRE